MSFIKNNLFIPSILFLALFQTMSFGLFAEANPFDMNISPDPEEICSIASFN